MTKREARRFIRGCIIAAIEQIWTECPDVPDMPNVVHELWSEEAWRLADRLRAIYDIREDLGPRPADALEDK